MIHKYFSIAQEKKQVLTLRKAGAAWERNREKLMFYYRFIWRAVLQFSGLLWLIFLCAPVTGDYIIAVMLWPSWELPGTADTWVYQPWPGLFAGAGALVTITGMVPWDS